MRHSVTSEEKSLSRYWLMFVSISDHAKPLWHFFLLTFQVVALLAFRFHTDVISPLTFFFVSFLGNLQVKGCSHETDSKVIQRNESVIVNDEEDFDYKTEESTLYVKIR